MCKKCKQRSRTVVLTAPPVFDYSGDSFRLVIESDGRRYVIVGPPKFMFAGFGSAKKAIRAWIARKGQALFFQRRDVAGVGLEDGAVAH